MYEGYEKLQKFVNMIGNAKDEMDALDVVVKIILAANEDTELEEQAIKYVNDCLNYVNSNK